MLTFQCPRSSIDKSAALLMREIRVGDLAGGATFGGACSVEASLSCKQAVVSATLTVSTKLSRSSAESERFPAKEEAASAILAGITTLWMVKHCVAVPCLENR